MRKGNRLVRLNERRPLLINIAPHAHVGRVPIIPEDPQRQRPFLCQRVARSIRRVRIRMQIEHIDRSCSRNPVLPVNFVDPPRQKIDARMHGFVVIVCAVPVEPPAARNRAEANRRRIPPLQRPALGDKCIPHLVICRGLRMYIPMRRPPDFDLVIHVIEMRSAAEGGCQRGRPRIAIHAVSRRAALAVVVKQRVVSRSLCVRGYRC
jgi:hypothetical protein